MKKIMKYFLTIVSILTLSFLSAQDYSRVRIFVTDQDIPQLQSLGINLDHVEYRRNAYIQADLSIYEIQKLDQAGYSYQITIQDVKAFYRNQIQSFPTKTGAFPCENTGNGTEAPTPNNFALGSMGGYLTYAEFLANLDSMASKYPNLITAKAPISTFLTEESRPIYHCIISDNPGTSEGESQVLYTAIHHAREPASLSQIIYYMWYLLENYATDAEVQYLVDNNELHFVPMINPDGYIYNETTDPNGGGMWRKNRRDNGGNVYGVDLNRNYSYQWGVSGTSTNPNDDTFCGPSAFSEPETQAIKWLCENNNFTFAFNAHTHGDLLLFPFGYASNDFAADHDYFQGIGDHMVQHNGYVNQKSSELYPAAGDSDDWMYDGDLGTKPKIFAFTPEIGPDGFGFWPPSTEIDGICKANIFQNMRLAHMPLVYGVVEDKEPQILSSSSDYFRFELTRFGQTAGDFTVSITPISGIQSVGSPKVISGMQILENRMDSISYTLSPSIQTNDEIKYVLNLDNGSLVFRDTLTKLYGNPTTILDDPGNDMVNWISSDWNTTTEDFVSPSSSITDSPNQNYTGFSDKEIVSAQPTDLSGVAMAYVSFYAKWEIEAGYDYVQFEVSSDNGTTWIPMCGNYTKLGTSNQQQDEPLYDGNQADWVLEEISLEDFLGDQIIFRFRLVSDIWVNGDGFYFDDFKVQTDGFNSIKEYSKIFSIYPNPAGDQIFIKNDYSESFKVQITDLKGKIVMNSELEKTNIQSINLSTLETGMYLLNIIDPNLGLVSSKKIVKR